MEPKFDQLEIDLKPEGESRENIDSPEKRKAFRVAFYGSAGEKTKDDLSAIKHARNLGSLIIKSGHSISDGGYTGAMKAVTEGAVNALKESGEEAEDRITAFALDEKYVGLGQIVKDGKIDRSGNIPDRLSKLIKTANAFVVLSGNLGTITELIASITNERVEQLPEPPAIPKPIIIVDESGKHGNLFEFLASQDKGFKSIEVFKDVYFFQSENCDEKVNQILEIYYKKSINQSLTEEEERLIGESNYKYSVDHYLENLAKDGYSS